MEAVYTCIGEFPLLWTGWECNPKGYILKDKKGKIVLSYDVYGVQRMSGDFLRTKLAEYKNAVVKTKKALAYLDAPQESS